MESSRAASGPLGTDRGGANASGGAGGEGPALSLRVLSTTDLHGTILPFDYATDRPRPGIGLRSLADTIRALRDEAAPNCLLLDNGDTLQGTPLADLAARQDAPGAHPVIVAMNALGYDAATLGNHDFDYGLGVLRRAVSAAAFPVVLSNLRPRARQGFARDRLILDRELVDENGTPCRLRIGIMGLAPPQTAGWVGQRIGAQLEVEEMLECARREAPRLRADGADIVIALAHTGRAADVMGEPGENVLEALEASGLADIVVGGHTHRLIPPEPERIVSGGAGDVPVVQSGARGSHLGVMDLRLLRGDAGRWRVARSEVRLLPAARNAAIDHPAPEIARAHARTRATLDTPIGHAAHPIESYGARLGHCSATGLIAAAMRAEAEGLLRDEGLPAEGLLVAAAVVRSGDRGRPSDYHDIAAGPLLRRHLFDLYPFMNHLCVVEVSGRDLYGWIERSAAQFRRIEPGPGKPPQRLISAGYPGYNFDVLYGVEAVIDVTRPAMEQGAAAPEPGEGRVLQITREGSPIDPAARFLVATTSYRVGGGGGFAPARDGRMVAQSRGLLRDALGMFIKKLSPVRIAPERPWRFAPAGGTTVEVTLGQGARTHAETLAELGWRSSEGDSEDGARFQAEI